MRRKGLPLIVVCAFDKITGIFHHFLNVPPAMSAHHRCSHHSPIWCDVSATGVPAFKSHLENNTGYFLNTLHSQIHLLAPKAFTTKWLHKNHKADLLMDSAVCSFRTSLGHVQELQLNVFSVLSQSQSDGLFLASGEFVTELLRHQLFMNILFVCCFLLDISQHIWMHSAAIRVMTGLLCDGSTEGDHYRAVPDFTTNKPAV